MKYLTRVLILAAVFVVSVYFMGNDMKNDTFSYGSTVEMGGTTFPEVSVLTKKNEINMLYGYGGNTNINNFRESITPVDAGKTVTLRIREKETEVEKVSYDVISVSTGESLFHQETDQIEEKSEAKAVTLKLDCDLEENTEYSLKVTLAVDSGKKIHYFTRIKYLGQCYVDEILNFAEGFHNATFNKEKIQEYSKYLETASAYAPTSPCEVNIFSNIDKISWGTMKPEKITTVVPTIKETNADTASVELRYLMKSPIMDDEGKVIVSSEVFEVQEFYRIRYTSTRIYLLTFERKIDAIADVASYDPSVQEDEKAITLGLTSVTPEELKLYSTEDNKKFCFINHGTLWYYDLEHNRISSIYSFMEKDIQFYHGGYQDNNIRILNIDNSGNINFVTYGYMNHGDYEGSVGLVLYKYIAEDERIAEQAYIPMDQPYEVLERELGDFYYLSNVDFFYFTLDNVVYSYSLTNRAVKVIAEDVTSTSCQLSSKGQFVAWQETKVAKENTTIHILNLETEQTFDINAPSGKNLVVLGISDGYLIYGIADQNKIFTTTDGSEIVPVSKMTVCDNLGNAVKEYEPKKGYINKVSASKNRIDMTFIELEGDNSYKESGTDYILNKSDVEAERIYTKTRDVSYTAKSGDKTYTYPLLTVAFPGNDKLSSKPKIVEVKNTILNVDTTVHVEDKKNDEVKYYATGKGHIIGEYRSAAEAVAAADEAMGVAMDNKNHIIWERGETQSANMTSDIEQITTGGGVNSIGACVSMILKYNNVDANATELSKSGKSIYQLLKENMSYEPVNLTGCSLSQALYYVSKKRPVIAMTGKDSAVLIIAYEEGYVTYFNPKTNQSERVGVTAAGKQFEEAGNVFVSYVK